MNRGAARSLGVLAAAIVAVGGCLGSVPTASPTTGPATSATAGSVAPATVGPGPAATPRASAGPAATSPAPAPTSTASWFPGPTQSAPAQSHAPTIGRRLRGAASATPMLRAALDARLEALRAKYGIPGVSVTIAFADGSVWRGRSGLADVAAGRSVTTDTAFSVASLSKTFTAALILGLVEDGRLSLESTARAYLPIVAIDPGITVRQLLDHTSGLRDFYFHPRIDKALLTRPARVWDAARSLSYVGKPYAKPGTSWHYSNTNYLVLGLLAEAVGGAPVADQIRDRFLEPLGLDHTWYQGAEAPRGAVARGYRFTGASLKLPAIDLSDGSAIVPFTSVVTASGAAGSMAGTTGDLVRWAKSLYGGGVLRRASMEAMVGDVLLTAPYKPTVGYGLGVQAVTVAGYPALGHSGRFLGARAVVRYLPGPQIAIAVATNQSRADPGLLLADLLTLALQPQPDCITCPAAP